MYLSVPWSFKILKRCQFPLPVFEPSQPYWDKCALLVIQNGLHSSAIHIVVVVVVVVVVVDQYHFGMPPII